VVTSFISSGSCGLLFLPSGTGGLLFLPSATGRRVVGWHDTNDLLCLRPAHHEKIAFVLVLCRELGA
jgi:hypothetical protein